MEDCRTPTLTTSNEFQFNITPTANNAPPSYKDIHHIMASRRSFTPVQTNFPSPGLSPIDKLSGSLSSPLTAHHSSSFMEFKRPALLTQPVVTYTPSPKYGESAVKKFLSPCQPVLGSNFSSSPSFANVPADINGSSPQLSDSRNMSVLNHSLSIKLLLKTMGLERYWENFENAGIDCNNLMNIKTGDLVSIGIKSDEDRNCIMEMFENCYST